MRLSDAAHRPAAEVLAHPGSSPSGLAGRGAAQRLLSRGPNAIRGHGAHPWRVLLRQVESPLLVLLVAAALASLLVGEHVDALIILAIISPSAGLGFVNEFRSERAV